MLIRLHKNARTTPAVRREIQDSDLGERALAKRHNISRATARKWRKRRDSTADGSHRPRTLRATLSPAQEAAAVELRRTLRLPLDDLVAVVREFIHPDVSRSGLDRCPRRRRFRPRPSRTTRRATGTSTSNTCPPSRASRASTCSSPLRPRSGQASTGPPAGSTWTSSQTRPPPPPAPSWTPWRRPRPSRSTSSPPTTARRSPTASPPGASASQPAGHPFDRGCAKHGIEHCLIPPGHPQTNGMVERFNGRIADVLKTTRFDSTEDLATTLRRYAHLYNHAIPRRALCRHRHGGIPGRERRKKARKASEQRRPIDGPGDTGLE